MPLVTARRPLGTGPDDLTHIRATEADLLHSLPGIRLPNLDDLRARGVLDAHPHAVEDDDQADEVLGQSRRQLIPPNHIAP